jgi:hypothetical protein
VLETIASVLLGLWLFGILSGYTAGNFIYVLLVSAVVLFLVRLITGPQSVA